MTLDWQRLRRWCCARRPTACWPFASFFSNATPSSPSWHSSCRSTVISPGALIPIFTRSRSTPSTRTRMLPEMTMPWSTLRVRISMAQRLLRRRRARVAATLRRNGLLPATHVSARSRSRCSRRIPAPESEGCAPTSLRVPRVQIRLADAEDRPGRSMPGRQLGTRARHRPKLLVACPQRARSSAAEHPAHNRWRAGSNPAGPTRRFSRIRRMSSIDAARAASLV